ncbi:MAG: acyl carrier protein [Anaerolineales bacterium]|jgi:acyl carrier protein
MNQNLLYNVRRLLADSLRVDLGDIAMETQFGDLPQWDSMGHMEVLVALEKEYGVEVTAETITELVSVVAIVQHIEANEND